MQSIMNTHPTPKADKHSAAVIASQPDNARAPTREDLARLRDEVARLHEEAARVRAEGARLREENARLRDEIDDLRASASHWRDLYEAASLRRLQARCS
jgi:predicted nuclease with TOPRIM domain